eukprot:CAMPEP_0205928186 /NCGR_PEP_ID=MMETSP1325-20131115/24227_1 /ASSEMBLY_ACC=CAM_ASM_000708 /TAXON_ID=236786 /ORGANISM="Florenciella sp., Strain RCC1007" /LENGTH=70 /DNA_ID=CAMNT_0053297177 /DNA_START=5 /DNA_END=217 /DNA_ORIENTATION=+
MHEVVKSRMGGLGVLVSEPVDAPVSPDDTAAAFEIPNGQPEVRQFLETLVQAWYSTRNLPLWAKFRGSRK